MSGDVLQNYDLASAALLSRPDVQVLSADQERVLVLELDGCKTSIARGTAIVRRRAVWHVS